VPENKASVTRGGGGGEGELEDGLAENEAIFAVGAIV
jgi:hypothetical protein